MIKRELGVKRYLSRFRILEALAKYSKKHDVERITMAVLGAKAGKTAACAQRVLVGTLHTPQVLDALRAFEVPEEYLFDPALYRTPESIVTKPNRGLSYSTAEMSQILGMSIKSTLAKARREGWESFTRPASGGGYMWVVASMPEATVKAVFSKLGGGEYAA